MAQFEPANLKRSRTLLLRAAQPSTCLRALRHPRGYPHRVFAPAWSPGFRLADEEGDPLTFHAKLTGAGVNDMCNMQELTKVSGNLERISPMA